MPFLAIMYHARGIVPVVETAAIRYPTLVIIFEAVRALGEPWASTIFSKHFFERILIEGQASRGARCMLSGASNPPAGAGYNES